ncbi:hypothetical protein FACS1894202_11360 [Clostridia bacterium]|nr:hypothetical protein FACS1894202_11360 [Clostridia bacterium]
MKSWVVIFAALPLGIVGAILRAFELRDVYDSVTGLAVAGAPPFTLILAGLAGVAVGFALVAALFSKGGGRREKPGWEEDHAISRFFVIAGAMILVGSCVIDFAGFIKGTPSLTIAALMLLGVVAAVCLVVMVAPSAKENSTAKERSKLTRGALASAPLFWGCFWFLQLFSGNAMNPLMGTYFWEFIAALMALLAFSQFAAAHFGKLRPALMTFFLITGIFFTTLAAGGPLIARLLFDGQALNDTVTGAGLLRLIFALVYMLAMPFILKRVEGLPDETPAAAEAEAAENVSEESENA